MNSIPTQLGSQGHLSQNVRVKKNEKKREIGWSAKWKKKWNHKAKKRKVHPNQGNRVWGKEKIRVKGKNKEKRGVLQ